MYKVELGGFNTSATIPVMSPFVQDTPFMMMPRLTRVVRILLFSTVAFYAVELVAVNMFHWNAIEGYLGLSRSAVSQGHIWQFVTYMFLHDRHGLMHILMNMLCLYFMGPDVERAIGAGRFLLLYFGCGIVGGIGWLLLSSAAGVPCIGASGAIFGVIGAFAGLFPRRQITLLVFFVLPLTMTAMVMAAALGLIALFSLLVSVDGGVAHAAHLAGGLVGYIYAAGLAKSHAFGLYDFGGKELAARTGWMGRLKEKMRSKLIERGQPSREEVDRILEKAFDGGLNSLTRKERDTLDRASRLR